MKVLINNLSGGSLSLDLQLGNHDAIRESLVAGASVDVSDKATADELSQSPQVQSLVNAGRISVTTESEAGDIESLLDSQMMEVVQQVAATVAETFLGTADMAGALQVEAQIGSIPAADENMSIDVLVNGVTVLSAPILADLTNSPVVRTQLFGDEQGVVVAKGDEISYSLTYVPGAGATPIIRTGVRVKILKAA